jgi:uncharacterized surface protein with fasciclin (FAS1) repeats
VTLLEDPRYVQRPVGQVLVLSRAPAGTFNVRFGLQEARIVQSDILSANGVIHIVDSIFVPPLSPTRTFGASDMFSRWMNFIRRANMVSTIDDLNGVTMFVPSNEAIARLGRLNLSTDQISTIIRYHIIPSLEYSSTLADNEILPTLQGESVTVDIQGNRIFVNDAEITDANILTANGVVHRINAVLIPRSLRNALGLE